MILSMQPQPRDGKRSVVPANEFPGTYRAHTITASHGTLRATATTTRKETRT